MNNNDIDIRILAKDISERVLKGVRTNIDDINHSVQSSAKSAGVLTGVISGLTSTITQFGLSIIQSGIQNLTGFLQDSVDAAVEFEKSMTTLDIIAPRFGVNAEDARKQAELLGKELRIGVGPAAEGIQNLLKGGLNLEQASDLMRRFANEAMTGKASTITLGQAVSNLTFAYTTNNSALGNLSGISENFSDITARGLELLKQEDQTYKDLADRYKFAKDNKLDNAQALKEELDAYEKTLEGAAKYKGMIELTNLTLGSSEKFTGTFIDKQAELNLRFEDAKVKLGQGLLPILTEVLNLFISLFDEVGPELKPIVDELLPKLAKIFKEEIVPKIKEAIPSLISFVQQFFVLAFVYGPQILDFFIKAGGFVIGLINKFNEFGNTLKNVISFLATLSTLAGGHSPYLSDLVTGNIPKFANGGDFVTKGPQLIMVGDNAGGRERVQITPLSSPNTSGPSRGGSIVNNFFGYDTEQISSRINQQIKLGY